MKPLLALSICIVLLSLNVASAVLVDAEYVTLYPGEEGRITIEVENNENFDIEDISISLVLDDVPFTSVGNSVKDIDDIDEDDDDSVSFTLRPSTDITPGDYNIPYVIKYVNAENNSENFTKEGVFGIRVSAKTDIDFSLEIRGNAIVGEEGRISLEIINRGLGEIKSVSVRIFPNGYELLSKDKIFLGTVNADDTDLASFDVIYKTTNPTLSAKVEYKDFDNKDQTETVTIPFKVYTEEQALDIGLINKNNTQIYILFIAILIVAWLIYRRIKKKRKKNRG